MKVEILSPPVDSFVVGRDLVGYAKVGNGSDAWEDLLDVAGAFSAKNGGTTPQLNALDVGTLSIPLKDMDPETDPRLRVGRRLRLFDENRSAVLWSGRLSDIPATDGQTHMVTTLAASDPIDELANAAAKGVGVAGEVESLRSRVERLGASSTVPLRYVPRPRRAVPADWNPGPSMTKTTMDSRTVRLDGAVPAAQTEFLAGLTIPLGLGTGVPIDVDLRASTVLNGGDLVVEIVGANAPVYLPAAEINQTLSFVAPAGADLTLRLSFINPVAGRQMAVTVHDLVVHRQEGVKALQAVGAERPLTEHLDMACDSVAAIWRPTLEGFIEVIDGDLDLTSAVRLSDDPDDAAADASYTKLDLGFAATDDLINELTVTNHGPSAETTRVYANAESIAAHGRRSTSIDLCLATGELMDARAAEILAAASVPRWSPRSVTYVYDDLAAVPGLYDVVTVVRRRIAHRCFVLGVEHVIEPDPARPNGVKHLVTLTLRKVA